jgi:hypothetical protein
MAQMKPHISRAIAVATMVGRLPFLVSARNRPESRTCAFQAIARAALGAASTFACFSRPIRGGVPVAPRGFHQHASRPPVASLGDATPLDAVTGRALGGHQTQIAHQLAGRAKARQVADLGQHRHRRDRVDAAHGLQRRDNLNQRPFRHRLAQRLLQPFHARLGFTHRPHQLLQGDTLLAVDELLGGKPIEMRPSPRLAARIVEPEPQQQRADLLAFALEIVHRRFASG